MKLPTATLVLRKSRIGTFIGLFCISTLLKAFIPLSRGYTHYLCIDQLVNRHENQGFTVPDYAPWVAKQRAQGSQDFAGMQNQINMFSRYQKCTNSPHFWARMRIFRWIPLADNIPNNSSSVGVIPPSQQKRQVRTQWK